MRLCSLWIICFIFSLRLSFTLLIWTCFRRGLFHSSVCQVARQQVSSTKVVYEVIMLSKSENILLTNSVGVGEDVDLIRGGFPRRRDNSLCSCVKEKISQLRQTIVRRPENGRERLLQWFPTMHLQDVQNSMEKYWKLCGECWGTYRSLAGIGTL